MIKISMKWNAPVINFINFMFRINAVLSDIIDYMNAHFNNVALINAKWNQPEVRNRFHCKNVSMEQCSLLWLKLILWQLQYCDKEQVLKRAGNKSLQAITRRVDERQRAKANLMMPMLHISWNLHTHEAECGY